MKLATADVGNEKLVETDEGERKAAWREQLGTAVVWKHSRGVEVQLR